MKQTLAFLTLSFLFCGIFYSGRLNAQNDLGIIGGLNFNKFHFANNISNVSFEKRDGFTIGVFYRKNNLLGPVGFQTELLYQLKGSNYFIEVTDTEGNGAYGYSDYFSSRLTPKSYYRDHENLHYLTIPLLLTFKTTKFLDLYAGPEFGYLMDFNSNREKSGEMNRISAGAAFGASVKLCDQLNMDFRYSTDLTSFDKLSKGSTIDLKNQGFSVTLRKTLFSK